MPARAGYNRTIAATAPPPRGRADGNRFGVEVGVPAGAAAGGCRRGVAPASFGLPVPHRAGAGKRTDLRAVGSPAGRADAGPWCAGDRIRFPGNRAAALPDARLLPAGSGPGGSGWPLCGPAEAADRRLGARRSGGLVVRTHQHAVRPGDLRAQGHAAAAATGRAVGTGAGGRLAGWAVSARLALRQIRKPGSEWSFGDFLTER